jgi:uncharacterized protein involved in outer membrane biogenesis
MASDGAETTTERPAPTPPPRKRRRWLRRTAVALVVLVVLVVLAPFALSIVPVRRYVAQRLSDEVGREVTIGGITARWWSGIELRDVRVANPPGYPADPLLTISRLHADVAVLRLLRGRVEAAVRCEKPVVSLAQGPSGAWNTEGLFPDDERRAKKRKERKKRGDGDDDDLAIHAEVVGGRLVSRGATKETSGEIDGIEADVRVGPADALRVVLQATAKGAGAGGADALLRAQALLDAAGAGTVQVLVPRLDLARVSGVAAAALGADAVAGSAALEADLRLEASGTASGRVNATLDGLSLRTRDGLVSLRSATLALTPAPSGEDTKVAVSLEASDLQASGFASHRDALVEPRVAVKGAVTRRKNGDLAFGDAGAPLVLEGKTLSGSVSGSMPSDPTADANLAADLRLVLSPTLGRLLGVLRDPADALSGTVSLKASATDRGDATDLRMDVVARDLVVGGAGGTPPWREPEATVSVVGTRTPDVLTLSTVKAAAGALTVAADGPVEVRTAAGAPPRVSGRVVADADLARLAGLRAVVAALDDVRGGTVRVEVAAAKDASRVDWTATARNLAFGPGRLSTRGHVEREAVVGGSFDFPEGGARTLTLARLSSSLVSLVPGTGPLPVALGGGGASVDGKATLALDLAVASSAFDAAMGLAPGERITGRLQAALAAKGSADDLTLDAVLSGTDVRPPPSWGDAGPVGGKVKVRKSGDRTTIDVDGLALLGVRADGEATIADGKATGTFDVEGDLERVGPLLAALPEGMRAAGHAKVRVEAEPSGSGSRVRARGNVDRFRWIPAKGPPVEEPSITLEADVVSTDEAHEVRTLALTSAAFTAKASGRVATGGAGATDLRGTLDGDGKRLAAHLRALLGEDYADLTGDGRLRGPFAFTRSGPADRPDLRVDADLELPRLSSGGMTLEGGRLTAKRAQAPGPSTFSLTSRVNGGTANATGSCDLQKDGNPWDGKAEVRQVDTSSLVVGKGAGRYLPMLLPAIVPANATTPVLSGRLDADLSLSAYTPGRVAFLDALKGSGRLDMRQGTVKDSTLFAGLAGGGGSPGLAKLLSLVPGLGEEIQGLSRSLLFTEMASRFDVGGRAIRLLEVRLVSEAVTLAFDGRVGFDGTMDLSVPVRLQGKAGKATGRFLKDGVVRVRVTGTVEKPRVLPDLRASDLAGGAVEDLLEKAGGLFGR